VFLAMTIPVVAQISLAGPLLYHFGDVAGKLAIRRKEDNSFEEQYSILVNVKKINQASSCSSTRPPLDLSGTIAGNLTMELEN
jgi:hypothetical protein